MALRTVGVRLAAEVSGYVNSLRTARAATTDFVGELNEAAKKGKLDAVADQARNMGLALTAGFGAIVAVGARFDKQMSAVSAATHASAQEMERLRQAALQAGADTAFSATEAAQGIEELAKAGVSTSDILHGGLRGALDLAAAGGIDVAEAAETAASAMTQFRLSGSQVPHVADLLAAAAGKAQGGVRDMSYALSQSGLVASQTGLTIEETTGALAAFASAGLIGSDAGTSFKTMLQRLVAPSGQAARTMQELGIRAFDAQGKFIGLEKFAGNLQNALAGLTDEQRNAALATIFGSDAIRAASVIYQQGEQGIRDWIKAVNDQGYAAETAAARTDNLMGDVERLTGSLETLAIESGSGVSGGLRRLTQMADGMVQSFSSLPGPVSETLTVLGGLTGVALLAGGGMLKLRTHTAEALAQLRDMGPAGARAASALGKVTGAAGKVAVTLALVNTAAALMGGSINPQVEALGRSMEEFAESGKIGGEAARVFGDDLSKLDAALSDVADTGRWSSFVRGTTGIVEGLTGLGNAYDLSLQHSRERLNALDQALTQLVQSGHGDQAAEIFRKVADRAAEQGVSVNELNQVLPGYAAALDGASQAQTNAILSTERERVALDMLKGTLSDAVDVAGSFKDAWDRLHGAMLDSLDANIAAEQAVDDLAESLAKNGLTMDLNTQKGRDNSRALSDVVKTARDAAQAKYEETNSVDQANAVYEQYKQKLYETLRQAGMTEAAAHALVEQWLKMPPLVSTQVITPGLDEALRKAGGLQQTLANINGSVARASVITYYKSEIQGVRPGSNSVIGFNRWGGLYEHAATGLLRDADIYSAASPGRYMIAEPETGGEAFVPKYGDRGRSLGILNHAASWYGAQVVPWERMAAIGGGINVERLEVRAYSDQFRLKQVMDDLAMHGVH